MNKWNASGVIVSAIHKDKLKAKGTPFMEFALQTEWYRGTKDQEGRYQTMQTVIDVRAFGKLSMGVLKRCNRADLVEVECVLLSIPTATGGPGGLPGRRIEVSAMSVMRTALGPISKKKIRDAEAKIVRLGEPQSSRADS